MSASPSEPVEPVPAEHGKSACSRCRDTGIMRWRQAVALDDGGFAQREMTHPCTCQAARDAGVWRHPAAEAERVVGHGAAAQHVPPGLAALLAALMPPGATPT
ncbi:hypothetical protein L6E12_27100 [Actinokineospora sp. PR83]|uniref:hypothetical protein n=1 Tax=Actinokineospora sp. PR83 TaxID=2884908 RepID=UPI001F33597F|nr:hypothetical protein [Actinokineospora sp. PR83]MCG8919449.1 hypothetical protein [Actinokineospora sp. PR83]